MVIRCKDYPNRDDIYAAITNYFGKDGIQINHIRDEQAEYNLHIINYPKVSFNIMETRGVLHVILNGPKKETRGICSTLDTLIKRLNTKTA